MFIFTTNNTMDNDLRKQEKTVIENNDFAQN